MGWNSTLLSDKNLAFVIVGLDVILALLRVFSALVTSYFLYRFGPTSLIHQNLKILLLFLPVGLTLVSVAQLTDQFLDLFGSRESYKIWVLEQFAGALYALFFLSCAFSLVFIYLERIIAVHKIRSYEEWGNAIGVWFVISNVVGSTFCTLMAVMGNCMLENPRSLQNTPGWNLIFWSTLVVSSALCLMLNHYISRCNLRYENSEQTLAERFQSQENKTSLVLLQPIILFFLICSIGATSTTALFMQNNRHQHLYQMINNSILIAMHLFAVLYIIRKHDRLWKIVRRDLCVFNGHQRRAVYATTFQEPNFRIQQETLKHFGVLETLWNKD